MIKENWWKGLGVLLVFISLTVGMLTPLRPGIVGLQPLQINAGTKVDFEIEGYNSQFSKDEKMDVWLWLDTDHVITASAVQVAGYQSIKATFDIPTNLPDDIKREAKLSTNDPTNGFVTALGRPFIRGGTVNPTLAKSSWSSKVENLHEMGGFTFPFLPNIYESVRNTFYHVSLWFAMFFTFALGVVQSIKYLRNRDPLNDAKASSYTSTGILFGILGLTTGMIWATYTWGQAWSWDIKQTMTAILLLVYLAYFVLRLSFDDDEKKARICAIYNIFAFACIVPLLYVIPRLVDSLHPGGQGNPAFGTGDLDMNVRVIFYMSVIGWCMIGYWMSNLYYRSKMIKSYIEENDF